MQGIHEKRPAGIVASFAFLQKRFLAAAAAAHFAALLSSIKVEESLIH
jgi:hypothetical protein